MRDRRAQKRAGRSLVRHNYAMLLVICLLAMVLRVEFNNTGALITAVKPEATPRAEQTTTITLPWVQHQLSDLFRHFWHRPPQNIKEAAPKELPVTRAEKIRAYGRRRALNAVNLVFSGHILVQIAEAIRSIVETDRAQSVVLILLSLLFYLHVWVFFFNVYRAMMLRMVLESRVYARVPYHRMLFFRSVGKLGRAAKAMLYVYLCQTLWNLTVVGGFIKYFSYFPARFIVAENPDIGGREAIRISRAMMQGHKKECFFFYLSFWPWFLLSFVSFGLTDVFYFCPYRVAALSEYYADLRLQAIERGVAGAEKLTDPALFARADDALLEARYADVPKRGALLNESDNPLGPVRKKLLWLFGLFVGRTEWKRAYQALEARRIQGLFDDAGRSGSAYPMRLNPLYKKGRSDIAGAVTYKRCYTVWCLALMFFFFCIFGWIWETAVHFIQTGEMINRGTLYGPWLPIYGMGGVVVVTVFHRIKDRPLLLFFSSMALCGGIEYISSYLLERRYQLRWWDYSDRILNINGRVCAEGLLVFGLASILVVYLSAPILDWLFSKINGRVAMWLSFILIGLCIADFCYARQVPHTGRGVTRIRTEDGRSVHYEAGSALQPD